MSYPNIDTLNHRFAITDHVAFEADPRGIPVARVGNAYALATVSLWGGHVTSYRPTGQEETIWVSRFSRHESGKAIRGGIPVCWPWFADHPSDPTKPAHGVVRTQWWDVIKTTAIDDGQTQIQLSVTDNEQTQAVWPHPFKLSVTVTIGPVLCVELVAVNTSRQSLVYGGALHTYIRVGQVTGITVCGLEDRHFIDKVNAGQLKRQHGPVRITGETDRVYVDTIDDCVIADPTLNRRVRIAKSNSRSTVVWNPWVEKAQRMVDFGNDEYHTMICVEAAHAGQDVITVAPGGRHSFGTQIGVEPLR